MYHLNTRSTSFEFMTRIYAAIAPGGAFGFKSVSSRTSLLVTIRPLVTYLGYNYFSDGKFGRMRKEIFMKKIDKTYSRNTVWQVVQRLKKAGFLQETVEGGQTFMDFAHWDNENTRWYLSRRQEKEAADDRSAKQSQP